MDDSENGLEAPVGSFLGLAKSGQYGLNYAGAVDTSADQMINMSLLNLERDFGKENKRYAFGQVSPMIKGSQSSLSLLGMSITAGPILNSIGILAHDFLMSSYWTLIVRWKFILIIKKLSRLNYQGGFMT